MVYICFRTDGGGVFGGEWVVVACEEAVVACDVVGEGVE